MSIQNFYSAAQQMEFARDFQFLVRALGPFTEKDLLYLRTAVLPKKSINNKKVPYMGLEFNVPGSVKYDGSDSWEVEFWCDEAYNIRNKMEAYVTSIFNDETSTGKYGVPKEVITLDLVGKNLETLRRYQLIGAYPTTVGEISYEKSGSGEPLKLKATFAYQFWRLIGA